MIKNKRKKGHFLEERNWLIRASMGSETKRILVFLTFGIFIGSKPPQTCTLIRAVTDK
jgi:hypothetical protein